MMLITQSWTFFLLNISKYGYKPVNLRLKNYRLLASNIKVTNKTKMSFQDLQKSSRHVCPDKNESTANIFSQHLNRADTVVVKIARLRASVGDVLNI